MVNSAEQTLLNDFDEANKLDKILIAHSLLEKLEEKASSSSGLKDELKAREEEIDRCKENYALVTKLLNDMRSDEGWKLAKQKKEVTVHYKFEDGSPLITTRASSLLEIEDMETLPREFVKLVSLFNESDLMPKWFPNKVMHACEVAQQVSTFAKYLHMLFHPPAWIPVSRRDAVVLGRGYDMTESGALAISYESKDPGFTEFGYTVPEPASRYTRVYTKGVFYLEIVEEGILFKTVSMVDIKLNSIPSFIMNLLSKESPSQFVANIKKVWRGFDGSDWEPRLEKNPELYNDVRERVSAFMASSNLNRVKRPLKTKKKRRTLVQRLTLRRNKEIVTPTTIAKFDFEIRDDEDEEEEEGKSPLMELIQLGENLQKIGEDLKNVGEDFKSSGGKTLGDLKKTVGLIQADAKDFIKRTKMKVKDFGDTAKGNFMDPEL